MKVKIEAYRNGNPIGQIEEYLFPNKYFHEILSNLEQPAVYARAKWKSTHDDDPEKTWKFSYVSGMFACLGFSVIDMPTDVSFKITDVIDVYAEPDPPRVMHVKNDMI